MPPEHFWHGPFGGPLWSPFGQFVVWGLTTLLWLLIIGAIIWAVMRLIRRAQPAQAPSSSEPSALEIVRRRYALGQIDRETFEEMIGRLLASEERDQPPVASA